MTPQEFQSRHRRYHTYDSQRALADASRVNAEGVDQDVVVVMYFDRVGYTLMLESEAQRAYGTIVTASEY